MGGGPDATAGRAHAAGARFWRGNDLVWLTEYLPSGFIATTAAAEGDAV
jgi:RNA:NAD 2'-phosphotransferase (TPT1/KptA family)